MEGRDELDRLIDGALADYCRAEPLAGIETRVLNRVRVVKAGRSRGLAWAVALVAGFIVVVTVVRTPRHPAAKTSVIARVVAPAPVPPARAVERPRARQKGVAQFRGDRQRLLPKLNQFPTPLPLTADERALLSFVEQRPQEAQQVFGEWQKHGDELIEIQPIQIAPLRGDGEE